MKNLKVILIISVLSLFFLSFNNINDKNKHEKKLYKKAQREYYNGNYKIAKNLYLQLLTIDSSNFNYNYELALLFFYELNMKSASIHYFKDASHYMIKDTIPDLYNYLGQAYYAAHRYDDAISSYEKYRKFPPKEGFLKISMTKYIRKCNIAKKKIKEYKKNKKDYGIINLGPNINTEYSEYTGFEIFSDSVIIFNTLRDFDIDFKQYIETIYISYIKNGKFTAAKKIIDIPKYKNLLLDQFWHEATIGVNYNETQMIVHRNNKLWTSNLVKGIWQKPVKFSKNINFNYSQEHASISGDGNTIYFSCYSKKNKNIDIYKSVKQADNKWGKAVKLGDEINSEKNEDSPEISEDGKTLYFSSEGHGSKGGYDIFKSNLINGKWTQAVSIDSLNSIRDDIFFKYSKKNNVAFFSSDRKGGFGGMDVYMVKFKK